MTSASAKIRLLVALLVGAWISPSHAQERAPDAMIRDFYQWYVQSLAATRDPFTAGRAEVKRYATERLIREIDKAREADELGADPFLDAQDFDAAWAKNITVSKPAINGDTATADVTLKGPEMGTHKLNVTLRKEGGSWKIDKVKGS